MRVGVALLPSNFSGAGASGVPDAQIYAEDLRLGRLAEPLGYDSIWTVEHHFSALTIVPSPLQFLTYFAGCTERVDLGTMVVVLPWHDPVRVAEEIAMLDNMLQGRRLTIGLGRGAGRREFEGLRVPAEQSRERFAEALEIVRRALTQERFALEGRHYSVPETELRPRPRSSDLVSRMRVAWMGSETVPLVAETGLGMLVGNQKPWEESREDVRRFNAVRTEHGLGEARPTVLIAAVCDEDAQEAERALRRHWLEQRQSIARHYERPAPSPDDPTIELQAWGSPEQVTERLQQIRELTDAEEFAVMFRFGGMPADRAERSMRLFSEQVLPGLHRWAGEGAPVRP